MVKGTLDIMRVTFYEDLGTHSRTEGQQNTRLNENDDDDYLCEVGYSG